MFIVTKKVLFIILIIYIFFLLVNYNIIVLIKIFNKKNYILQRIIVKKIYWKILTKKNIRKNILVESLTKKILWIYEYINLMNYIILKHSLNINTNYLNQILQKLISNKIWIIIMIKYYKTLFEII